MAEDTDSLDLTERQKTRLLSLGLEPDRPATTPDGNELRGDLLCDMLRCPLPPEGSGPRGVPVDAGKPCLDFRAVAGPPLRELLLDPETDVVVLRRIKEYAKTLGTRTGSEVEKDVFLVLYFAAIAAAMVFHDERITEHSSQDLTRFFGSFARLPWVPNGMGDLLGRAENALATPGRKG